MSQKRKLIVVMPAYNAEKTLEKTVAEIPRDIVDTVIVVDDNSRDGTEKVAKKLDVVYYKHKKNLGYGGNQKTCYRLALEKGADMVIMVHPDYQYTPKLIRSMAALLASDLYDIVLASRIIGDQTTRKKSMPWWRYIANRGLTAIENLLLHYKLSDYHTGYRGYNKEFLQAAELSKMSDDFVFDNQLLAHAVYNGFKIGEISCPTSYSTDASSINFKRSVEYGLGVVAVSIQYRLAKWGWYQSDLFGGNA